jgi:hypothetical protein
MIIINNISRDNFIGAPFITLAIYGPLIIVQSFLLIQIWIIDEKAVRAMKWTLIVSISILLIFVYFLFDYLMGTS